MNIPLTCFHRRKSPDIGKKLMTVEAVLEREKRGENKSWLLSQLYKWHDRSPYYLHELPTNFSGHKAAHARVLERTAIS